ncbi:MAG: guanylate kinase [Clostridia bacterium]
MSRQGILFVISGPSGAGKGTVLREVFKRVEGLNFSVSATTRKIRAGEADGVNYFFISDDKFDKMIKNGEMLEFVGKYGNRYGTPKDAVKKLLDEHSDVVLEIETVGATNVKRLMPNDTVAIFIAPPSLTELWERLDHREAEENCDKELRFRTSIGEMMCAYGYDYLVVNDDLNECVDKVVHIIEAERNRIQFNKEIIQNIIDKG